MIKIKNPYLQFVFVEDLDQIYENELSEALKIKQKKDSKHIVGSRWTETEFKTVGLKHALHWVWGHTAL